MTKQRRGGRFVRAQRSLFTRKKPDEEAQKKEQEAGSLPPGYVPEVSSCILKFQYVRFVHRFGTHLYSFNVQ